MSLSLSGRWADYKSYGRGSTYKAGAVWSPTRWLTLRGTTGTSYRAPALYEQFLGATSSTLPAENDPCNNWDSAANAGTVRSANCRSEGLPAGFVATQTITVRNAGGAAAGLKAETSENSTFGAILQPELGAGWGEVSLALDAFDIKVDNSVTRAGAPNILARCYDDPQFRAGGSFCRLVNARNPSSNRLTVNDNFVNLATDIVRGHDLTARYSNSVGAGRLRIEVAATRYQTQAGKLFDEDALDDVNGTLNNPKWSGTLAIHYERRGWRLHYGLDWVDSMSSYELRRQDPATSTLKLCVPSYITHTVAVGYKAAKWDVTAGVRNLADIEPPMISALTGYSRVGNALLHSGYDYAGRTFYLNLSRSF